MNMPTYFVQVCPTCGRNLEIRVEFLGRRVTCQHCRGRFVASDDGLAFDLTESGILMRRAQELLDRAARLQAANTSAPHSVP